jgi:hypothetical protein
MRITSSEGELGYVQIEAGEGASQDPGLRVEVTAASRGFSGFNEGIWLEHDQLSMFCDELAGVLRVGRGVTQLSSMSPREFTLRLETVERPFGVLVTTQVRRVVYPHSQMHELAVEVAFPVEFASLAQVLADVNTIRERIGSDLGS